jgi:hypothetical protein
MKTNAIRKLETIEKGLELTALLEDLDYSQRISLLTSALCVQFVLSTEGNVTQEFIDGFVEAVSLNSESLNATYKDSLTKFHDLGDNLQ